MFDRYVRLLELLVADHFRTQRSRSADQWRQWLAAYITSEAHHCSSNAALRVAGFTERDLAETNVTMTLPYTVKIASDGALAHIRFDADAMWQSHQPMFSAQ